MDDKRANLSAPPQKLHKCNFCAKLFNTSTLKFKHQKYCFSNPERPKPRRKVQRYDCPKCGHSFYSTNALNAHITANTCHEKKSYTCYQPGCDFTYFKRLDFLTHLRNFHKIGPEEVFIFSNWLEFRDWKATEEAKTYSCYTQRSGPQQSTWYFYCQRDGSEKPHYKKVSQSPESSSDGEDSKTNVDGCTEVDIKRTKNTKRYNTRKKGRVKTGTVCPASIKVKQLDDGSLMVRYFSVHCHPLSVSDLIHQPLDAETSEFITNQIILGVPPSKIKQALDERAPFPSKSKFITVHAIHERRRHIFKNKKVASFDELDVTSLYLKPTTNSVVEALCREPSHPVLVFKPLNGDLLVGPNSAKKLPANCFMLGLQSKEQLALMKEFSKEILIIDVTLDVSHYGCHLLNIIGVDEVNKEYPLAHCLSNNLDEETIKYFFAAIKERAPDLKINCIITAVDSYLVDAIRSEFHDQSICHILCLWHFKIHLQRQVEAKVPNQDLRAEVFKIVCALIDSETESYFQELLSSFRQEYKNLPMMSSFLKFFMKSCLPIKEKWAMCFRKFPHMNVDTIAYGEAFHSVLKAMYMKLKPREKSVDILIEMLVSAESEYYSWRDKKIVSGDKVTNVEVVTTRHELSQAVLDSKVVQIVEDCHWLIRSEAIKGSTYEVLRCSHECTFPDMCFFQCTSSTCTNLCSHLYVCTCADVIPLCKHIHKVHSLHSVEGIVDSSGSEPEDVGELAIIKTDYAAELDFSKADDREISPFDFEQDAPSSDDNVSISEEIIYDHAEHYITNKDGCQLNMKVIRNQLEHGTTISEIDYPSNDGMPFEEVVIKMEDPSLSSSPIHEEITVDNSIFLHGNYQIEADGPSSVNDPCETNIEGSSDLEESNKAEINSQIPSLPEASSHKEICSMTTELNGLSARHADLQPHIREVLHKLLTECRRYSK